MPSPRSLALGAGFVALVVAPGSAAAQTVGAGSDLGLGPRLATRFVASLVVNLLLGGGLVALAPAYAEETVAELRDDPGGAFGWGLVVGLVVPIGLFVLAVTVVGLVVAIPGFVLLFLVGVVGNAVTVVWLGTFVGDERPDGRAAGLGAFALALVSAVPVLGNLAATLVGFFGLGVVGRRLYESYRGDNSDGREPRRRVERQHEDL